MIKKGLISLIKKRKTTYDFNNKNVKSNYIKSILEAGRWAPSCSNIQPWKFVVIKNRDRIDELIKISSYGAFHTSPNVMIVPILKKEYFSKVSYGCVIDSKIVKEESRICIGMASMNMLLEATDLGIDSCILTPNHSKIAKILKLDKGDDAPIILGFGYEKKGVFQKNRKRKSLKELIIHEHFK